LGTTRLLTLAEMDGFHRWGGVVSVPGVRGWEWVVERNRMLVSRRGRGGELGNLKP
jgi:hypothetical protein